MSLFGRGKQQAAHYPGVLGVDFGSSGVKLVELVQEGGRPRLVTYGYAERESGVAQEAVFADKTWLTAVFQKVYKESQCKATNVVVALPSASVFHAIVSVPDTKNSDDLQAAVEAQASKLMPLPVSEMMIDSTVIARTKAMVRTTDGGRDDSYARVLVTGALRTVITEYVDFFKGLNLNMIALETETAALSRALVGPEKGRVMLVDVGATRTTVAVLEDGIPMLVRGIKSGGAQVTQALSSSMGLQGQEAESMKRDLVLAGDDSLPEPLSAAVKPILHELRYTFGLYADEHGPADSVISKVILTGGSSGLVGLRSLIESTLNVNTYIGNPWARIAAPTESWPLLDEVGSRLAVSTGLAMRPLVE